MSAFILSSLERRNRALILGITAGLRAATPSGILAFRYKDAHPGSPWTKWVPFRYSWGRVGAELGTVGEMIGDKLPTTPSRLQTLPLLGRIASGGFAGAVIGSELDDQGKQGIVKGAVVGAIGGAIGSFAGYHLRRLITSHSALPDLPVAIAEDLIAIALAVHATRRD